MSITRVSARTNFRTQLKMMFAGDSLTKGGTGSDTLAYGGYRTAAIRGIVTRIGTRARFVGAQLHDGSPMCGENGLTVGELKDNPYLAVQLAQFRPHEIWLHIGTNDCSQRNSTGTPTLATTRTNLTALLDLIYSVLPKCKVRICRIIDHQNAHTEVTEFNQYAIDTDVVARAEYASGLIRIVDMYTAIGVWGATNYVDAGHLNGVGYAVMASTWLTSFYLDY